MAPYARDWSGAEPLMPDVVVRARRTEDVQAVLRAAQDNGVPVTPRGLGTGKSGGALPLFGGVVLSMERMRMVHEVRADDMLLVADAGAVTAQVMAAAESEGLFYPPDPNSLDICSIGGNVACNAGGPRALKYGVTKHYVLGLEVVLANGRRVELGKRTVKHVTGYDLAALIVGSEGTLGVITQVTLRLVPQPRAVHTALVAFASARTASVALTGVLTAGVVPRTLELLDRHALDAVRAKTPGRFPPDAGAVIILETDGPTDERAFEDLERAASVCLELGALDVQVAQDAVQREKIWAPRRLLSETLKESAEAKISEDVVVPRSHLPELLEAVERIGETHGVRVASYGHAGDGNLHVNVLFDKDQRAQADRAVQDLLQTTIGLGGTISGEHGIGLLKRDFLPWEQAAPVLAVQRHIKAALDPLNLLNPGKILPLGGAAS
ncbi:MAG: FAD-binding protein [Deltaproteobacteria bacterium]|nr:FAD-binding protein [Deltaproteobacteria bacterium]